MGKLPRLAFGAIVGMLAGVSFGVTVLPLILDKLVPALPNASYLLMARFAFPAAVLWIPGGALAAISGGWKRGALYMGGASLIAGVIYGFLIAPGIVLLQVVTVSALVAVLYGAGAGILLGLGFPPPMEEDGTPLDSKAADDAAENSEK